MSIKGHIPEKDGILANLLILEAIATSKKTLVELQEELYEIAGTKFYTDRIDLELQSQNEIQPILEKAKNIKAVGEYKVTSIDTKDGIKLMLGNNTKILVRPSGTEPLLRIYFETDDKENLENLMQVFKI